MWQSESVPPHNTTEDRAARIQSAPMPNALAPEEQAVDTVIRGPPQPKARATSSTGTDTGVSSQSDSTGERALGCTVLRYDSSPVAMPPVVVPSTTPTSPPSSAERPAMSQASRAAISASTAEREARRRTAGVSHVGGVSSRTSAAHEVRKPLAENT